MAGMKGEEGNGFSGCGRETECGLPSFIVAPWIDISKSYNTDSF